MAHVLVVDDDSDLRETMRRLLEEMGGHSVVEAEDGIGALEVLRASEDRLVVLLDQRLPRMDASGVLERVAADDELATRHVYILLTASSQLGAAPTPLGKRGLVIPLIAKPFDIETLLDAVALAARQT
jgi:CheY-like chemotaxis protein